MTQIENKQASDGMSKFLLIFGAGWTVFSLIFVMIGILIIGGESYTYNQLMQDGKLTQAMITRLNISTSDESTGYYVTYEFKAPVNGDPAPFSNTEWVPEAFYNSLRVEQRVEVIYLASDPTTVRLKSQFTQPSATAGWFFVGLGGFFLLIGLAIGVFGLISRNKS